MKLQIMFTSWSFEKLVCIRILGNSANLKFIWKMIELQNLFTTPHPVKITYVLGGNDTDLL